MKEYEMKNQEIELRTKMRYRRGRLDEILMQNRGVRQRQRDATVRRLGSVRQADKTPEDEEEEQLLREEEEMEACQTAVDRERREFEQEKELQEKMIWRDARLAREQLQQLRQRRKGVQQNRHSVSYLEGVKQRMLVNAAENDVKRHKTAKEAFNIRPSLAQVGWISGSVLLRVLMTSLFVSVVPVAYYLLLYELYGIDKEGGEGGEIDAVADRSGKKSERDQLVWLLLVVVAPCFSLSWVLFIRMTEKRWIDLRTTSAWTIIVAPTVIPYACNMITVVATGHTMRILPLVATAALAVFGTGPAGISQLIHLRKRDLPRQLGIQAARQLRELEAETSQSPTSGNKRKKRETSVATKILSGALPYFLCCAALVVYPVVLFPLYRAFPSTEWRVGVVCCSLFLKITGNKLQLNVMSKAKRMPYDSKDACNFAYELLTSLLNRVMLTSIPDETLAVQLAVLDALLETFVRAFYTARHTSRIMHTAIVAKGSPQHDVLESQQRAIDNMNNMVCEYATAIIGAAMLLFLPRTPFFVLASAERVSTGQVVVVTLAQLLPEFMVDVYSTALEAQGAMMQAYEEYLRRDSIWHVLLKMMFSAASGIFLAMCCLKT